MENNIDKYIKQIEAEKATGIPNKSDGAYGKLLKSSYNPSKLIDTKQSLDKYADYGVPIYGGVNLDDQLASNQSVGEQLGKGALRLGASTLLKAGQGFSMLGSAVGELAFGWAIDGSIDFEDIVDNPINDIFFKTEDYIKNNLEIYKPRDWAEQSIWQQLGSTAWWGDEFSDGLAFALSTLVPAGAIGKMGLGLKATNALSKAGAFRTALSGLDDVAMATKLSKAGLLSNPVAWAKGIDGVSQIGLVTSMEALQEGRDTREQVRTQLAQQLGYYSYDAVPDEIKGGINEKAANAGKNTFWWNMVALAPSNMFEISLLNKFLGKAANASTKGMIELGENVGDVAKRVGRKGLSKFFNENGIGSGIKTLGQSMAIEGLYEENIQQAIQDVTKRYGAEGRMQSMVMQLPDVLEGMIDNLSSNEGQKSIVSGMLIGGLMGGASGYKSAKNQNKHADALIGRLNEATDNFLKTKSLYEYDEVTNEDGTITKALKLDEDGSPVVDKRALAEFAANRKAVAELKGLEEDYQNDDELLKLIKNEQLSKYVAAHMEAGLGEEMLIKLDANGKTNTSDLEGLGFAPFEIKDGVKSDFATESQNLYNRAKSLKDSYETFAKYIPAEESERLKESLRTKARIDYLQSTTNKLRNDLTIKKSKLGIGDPLVESLDEQLRVINSLTSGLETLSKYDDVTKLKYATLLNDAKRKYIEDYTNSYDDLKAKNLVEDYVDLDNLKFIAPQSNSAEALELQQIQNRITDSEMALDSQVDRLGKLTDYVNGKKYFEDGLKASIYRKQPLQLVDIKEGDILKVALGGEDLVAEVGMNNGVLSIREFDENGEESFIELTQELLDNSFAQLYTEQMRAFDIRLQQTNSKIQKRKNDVITLTNEIKLLQNELDVVISELDNINDKISVKAIKSLLSQRNKLEKKKQELENKIDEKQNLIFEIGEEINTLQKQLNIDNSIDPLRNKLSQLKIEYDILENDLADSKTLLRRVQELLKAFDSVVELVIDSLPAEVQPTFLSLYKKLASSTLINESELTTIRDAFTDQIEDGSVGIMYDLVLSKRKELENKIKELKKAKSEIQSLMNELQDEITEFEKLLTTYDFPFVDVIEIEDEELDLDNKKEYSEIKAKKFYEKNKSKQIKLSYNTKDGNKEYRGYLVPTETGYKFISILSEEDKKNNKKPATFTSEKIHELVNKNGGKLKATRFAAPRIINEDKELQGGGKLETKSPKKPYISNLLKTAGLFSASPTNDSITSDNDQQRWFQFTEELADNEVYLVAYHKGSKDAPKGLPFYDDDTIMIVPHKDGSPVLFDGDIVFTSIPKSITLEEAKEKYTTKINGKQLTDKEIQSYLSKLDSLRSDIFDAENGYPLEITGKSSGIRTYLSEETDGKTHHAVENILLSGESIDDLDLVVAETDSITLGSQTIRVDAKKIGKVFLRYKNLLIETFTRVFGEQEVDDLIQVISEYSTLSGRVALKSKLGKEYVKYKTYLKSTLNFGANPEKNIHGIRFNNSKLEFKFNGTDYGFYESQLRDNKLNKNQLKVIKEFLKTKRHQVDKQLLKDNEAYIEYANVDGKLEQVKKWKSYKEFLLSSDDRNEYEIPLLTSLVRDENGFIAKGVYLEFDRKGSAKKVVKTPGQRERIVRKNKSNDIRMFGQFIENNLLEEQGKQYELQFGENGEVVFRIILQVGDKINQSRITKVVKTLDAQGNELTVEDGLDADLIMAINNIVNPTALAKQLQEQDNELLDETQKLLINISEYVEQSATEAEQTRSNRQRKTNRKSNAQTKDDRAGEKSDKNETSKIGSLDDVAVEEKLRILAAKQAKRQGISEEEAYTRLKQNINNDANKLGKNRLRTSLSSYVKEDLDKAKTWFKARFPNVEFEVVTGIIKGKAWGRVEDSSRILISDEAEIGTTYHEAFHYVTQFFLDDNKRNALYDTWRKINNSTLSNNDVEEKLAEEFREYVLTNGESIHQEEVKGLFKRLWNFIKSFFIKPNTQIKDLFNEINKGSFKNASLLKYQIEEGFNRPASKFDRPALNSKIMSALTYQLFEYLYEDGGTIADLVKGGGEIDITELYDKIELVYYQMAKSGKDVGQYVIDNWDDVLSAHAEYLTQFDLNIKRKTIEDFTEDESEVDGRNKSEYQEVYLTSSKDKIPAYVKLLVAGLPKMKWVENNGKKSLELRTTILDGLPEIAEYDKTLTILGQHLAGAYELEDMVKRIESIVDKHPEMQILLNRLKISSNNITPDSLSEDDVRLQNQFFRQFSIANNTFYITMINDNEIYQMDANSQRLTDRIKEKWRNALRDQLNTPDALVKVEGNIIVVDTDAFIKATKGNLSFNKKVEILSKLGITFTKLEEFTAQDKNELAENFKWIITHLSKEVSVSDMFNKKQLDLSGNLNSLLYLEAKYNDDIYELQHINPEGKTVYSLMFNNGLSLMLNKLKKEGQLAHHDNLYAKNSYVLKNLDKHLPELRIVEGVVAAEVGSNKITSELVTPDYISNYISNVLNGVYPIMRTSDKKTDFALDMGIFIGPSKSNKIFDRDKLYKILFGYLEDEIETSRQLNIKGLGSDVKHYNNNAKSLRFFDYLDIDGLSEVLVNDEISVKKFLSTNSKIIKSQIDAHLQSLVDEQFKLILDNKLIRTNKDDKSKYDLDGIGQETSVKYTGRYSKLSEDDVKRLLTYFTANLMIANQEQFKLFIGDPAFYKSVSDIFKRTSSLTSPRRIARNDVQSHVWLNKNMPRPDKKSDGIIKTSIFADAKVASELISKWKEILTERGSKRIEKILEPYYSITEADGQGIISLPEYREMLWRFGAWEEEHEVAYQKVINGEELSNDEMFLFQPIKPSGFGAVEEMIGDLYVPSFFKLSLYPIYPQLVKDTQLEKVYNGMLSKGIGMTVFESGVKSGVMLNGTSVQPLYKLVNKTEQDGDINSEEFLTRDVKNDKYVYEIDFGDNIVTQGISYNNFGIQVDISPEDYYEQTVGTQQQKLVLLNLKVNGEYKKLNIGKRVVTKTGNTYIEDVVAEEVDGKIVVDEYLSVTKAIVNKEFTKLVKSLGFVKDGENYRIGDWGKVRERLVSEAKDRQLPRNIIVGIDEVIARENKTFDVLVNRKKIESLLVSFVNNKIVKRKTNGQPRVQVAVTGFEQERAVTFDKKGKQIMRSSDLKAYDVDDKGITKHMQVKTTLPKSMLAYVESIGGLNVFNRMIKEGRIDPRILRMIGFRIPTQGHNSMVVAEVVEFLPYQSGNIIILPSEITTIAGSDFDIDKLNLYFANFKVKNGSLTYTEYGNKPSLDRYLSFLRSESSKDANDYINFLKPEEYDKLAKEKLEKYKLKGDIKEARQLVYTYGLEYFRASVSKNLQDHYKEYERIFKSDNITGTNKIAAYVAVTNQVLKDNSFDYIGLQNKKEVRFTETLSSSNKSAIQELLNIYADELLLAGISQENVNSIIGHDVTSEYTDSINKLDSLQNKINDAYNTIKLRESSLLKEMNNSISFEEFLNLPVEEQYSTLELQNRLIELNELILTAKENFENLITPNFEDNKLKGLAKEMKKIYGEESRSYSRAITLPHIVNTASAFWKGKKLLGIAAKTNVHHVLSQLAELYINDESVDLYFKGIKKKDGKYRLDNEFTTNGDSISEIISEFINAFVDVAKDPYVFDISAVQETVNVIFYLLRTGVNIDTIVYFINQPIIRDYITKTQNNKSLFREAKSLEQDTSEIINNTRGKYLAKFKAKNKNNTLYDISLNELQYKYDNNGSVETLNRINKIKNTYVTLDDTYLKDMLNPDSVPMSFYEAQLQILDNFLEYNKQAQQLTELTLSTSHDTVGLGKNLNNAILIEDKVKDVLESDFFGNVDKLFDDTSFLSIYRNIVNEASSMYSNFFLSKNPKALNEVKRILSFYKGVQGYNTNELVAIMDKVSDDLITWLLHTSASENRIALESQFKSLLMGENSIAQRVIQAYENELNDFNDGYIDEINPLLAELYPIINPNVKSTNGVRLFSKMMNTYESNMYTDAFNELYNSEPILAADLVKVSILQSGLDNSPISFNSIVPNNKYIELAYESINEFINGDVTIDNFFDDFYRNNYGNDLLVKSYPASIKEEDEDGNRRQTPTIRGNKLFVKERSYKTKLPYLKVYAWDNKLSDKEIKQLRKDKIEVPKVMRIFKNSFEKTNGKVIFIEMNKKGNGRFAKEFNRDFTLFSKLENNNITDIAYVNVEEVETENEIIDNTQNTIVEIFDGIWTRDNVSKEVNKVFLFGDNTEDRLVTKHIPNSTQAVIRGLPNAIGIDTKKTRKQDSLAYFTDKDFNIFKNQVDEAINKALDSGKIIVIPKDGIGTGKAMLKDKAPKLFQYLSYKLESLKVLNNDTLTQQEKEAVIYELKNC